VEELIKKLNDRGTKVKIVKEEEDEVVAHSPNKKADKENHQPEQDQK